MKRTALTQASREAHARNWRNPKNRPHIERLLRALGCPNELPIIKALSTAEADSFPQTPEEAGFAHALRRNLSQIGKSAEQIDMAVAKALSDRRRAS